ncbi:hypothetical protein LR48_Vigan501s000300 [Vigna angularis]|uniref:Uncharacterized protein n=1 Tax=Phaseolus angularis TaxID=3914 RepID=A0A0L9TCL8_PHAAN|nr:hypothetical protein LR48_Vigan501s000300 [Vigna angularis]
MESEKESKSAKGEAEGTAEGHFTAERHSEAARRTLTVVVEVAAAADVDGGTAVAVIANEIQLCANTMNNRAPLGHPSLITHLCELAGVNISTLPFERPRKAIDEAYYRQYCGRDEATQPVPPCHPRQVATVEIIIRMYDTPLGHRWTMDEFNNVVAWLEDQAQDSKAGAVEAPTMDDDEDDFKGAEEEGEEEDSDHSIG